jgi:hypothetical protein
MEILRAGLVSASAIGSKEYETFDLGLWMRTQPWF